MCVSCEMATWINKTKRERSRRARSRGDYGASFFLFPKTGAYIYLYITHTHTNWEPKSDVTFDPQNLADSSAASHWRRVGVYIKYTHSRMLCVYKVHARRGNTKNLLNQTYNEPRGRKTGLSSRAHRRSVSACMRAPSLSGPVFGLFWADWLRVTRCTWMHLLWSTHFRIQLTTHHSLTNYLFRT